MLGALVGGGLSLLGGLLGNSAKSKEAAKNRQFQLMMAKNAHQFEVEDLRKAGLNPILSGTGGPGAKASGGAQADQSDVITPAVNSALSAMRNQAELKLINEQAYKAEKEGDLANQQRMNLGLDYNAKGTSNIEILPEQVKQAKLATQKVSGEVAKLAQEKLKLVEETAYSKNSARKVKIEADVAEWMNSHGLQEIGSMLGAGKGSIELIRALIQLFQQK